MALTAWSIGVVLLAVLLGLPHFPWVQPKHPLDGVNFDFLESRYQDYIAEHPLPPIQHYPTRDGAQLAVRVYVKSENRQSDYKVVLHHGTASDSTHVHPMAVGMMQERGMDVYVPDIRGHGESITSKPGDLDYMWQNLDDLEDLLEYFKLPPSQTVFVGHSAQGGGAWYLASRPAWRRRFAGFVALAPMLGLSDELIIEPNASNFGHPNVPRLIALVLLDAVGVTYFNHQSAIRFYIKPAKDVDNFEWQNNFNMVMSHAPLIGMSYERVIEEIPDDTRVLSISAGAD